MRYLYECRNEKCSEYLKNTTITKPISESDRPEICEKCDSLLFRVYKTGICTGDGFKG